MSCEEISTVRFAVFVQGRSLRDWEWKSIESLRAGGAICLFILVPPDVAPGGRARRGPWMAWSCGSPACRLSPAQKSRSRTFNVISHR